MQGPSRNQSQPSNQTFAIDVTSQDRSPVEDQCAVQSDGDPSRAPSGQTDTEVTMVTESRRPSVADPEADSAMGIAQKVCRDSCLRIFRRLFATVSTDIPVKQQPSYYICHTWR
jgi:hypothetical protein